MFFWRKRRRQAEASIDKNGAFDEVAEEENQQQEEASFEQKEADGANKEPVEADTWFSMQSVRYEMGSQAMNEPKQTAQPAPDEDEANQKSGDEQSPPEGRNGHKSRLAPDEDRPQASQEPAQNGGIDPDPVVQERSGQSTSSDKSKAQGNTETEQTPGETQEEAVENTNGKKKGSAKKKKQEEDTTQRKEKRTAIMLSNALLREQVRSAMNENPDLQARALLKRNEDITIFFVKGAINEEALNHDIVSTILEAEESPLTNDALIQAIPIARVQKSDVLEDVCKSLIDGFVFVHVNGKDNGLLYNLSQPQYRSLAQATNEANVLGPKTEFTESLETNTQILRQMIKNENLIMESMTIGKRAPKEVRIVYMKDLANEENVQAFRERLSQLDVDDILDASVLIQMIEENEYSIFPQLIQTEQPQRLSYALMSGKVGLLLNGSPMAVIGPVTFFSFFESTEDLYFRWNISTFLRILRFLAMIISIVFTPGYVAALTYHYEIIPSALLVSIGQSRANVPFPPVMEALLLEGLIELLREAGARLPTKVGQTIGIVGGIVIGQAAVQAGFTSNILIIVVALSALASFTAPNYVMGTVIRIIRFPLILLAGLAGGIGMMFGLCFLLIHLLKITSLNRPYLAPIYPFHWKDMAQSLIRVPHRFVQERPSYNETPETIRKRVKPKGQKKDIDE